MIYLFYFFAAVLTFLGYKSLRGGINYLDFFRRELARPPSGYAPVCSIIAPCRGLDKDLRENLNALFSQSFPAYEIVFVVDAESDESVSIIKSAIAANAVPAKIVIAGKAKNESQKVHNLRRAVLEVSGDSEIFVFVDSDARPGEGWLRNLIAPLEDESIGCATGYRWFVQKNGGFATHLRAVWNASIASALGANMKSNFCWGGSLALRRETFGRLNLRERWRGCLSDDFAITTAMKEAKLPIRFVPQCLTATIEDCTLREFLEFSTRQIKITRVCAAPLWTASLIGSLLFTVIFWSGIFLLFLLSGAHFWVTLFFLSLIFAFGAAKAWLRLQAVRLILKNYEKQLNKQLFAQLTFWAITPLVFFYNCVCALFSREIVWRGIRYRLKSATETEILSTNKS